jgi:cytidylate kinase
MKIKIGKATYTPGYYGKMRPFSAALSADNYKRAAEKKLSEAEGRPSPGKIPPTVCFSRKIGVGALEIADMLAEKIGYTVIDREILEHIADEAKLESKTVAIFDERYPGEIDELVAMLFGEKSFVKSDYTRLLFKAVFSIANAGPTIFVGRGTHLLLPRERVLAVRFICSKERRIRRLAEILKVSETETEKELEQMDKEQNSFFKKVYGKKEASPYEFDMVVNCDCITESRQAAGIVAQAFREKFGDEINVK